MSSMIAFTLFTAASAFVDPGSAPVLAVNASKPSHGLIAHAHLHKTVHGHETSTDSFNAAAVFASAQVQGLAAFSLGRMGAQCKCAFHGTCNCDAALEFMDCIAAACQSGTCSCQSGMHFLYACHNMSAVCPSANLMCSTDSASCYAPEAQAQPVAAAEPQKPAATEAPATKEKAPEKSNQPSMTGSGPMAEHGTPYWPRWLSMGWPSAPTTEHLPEPRLPTSGDLPNRPEVPDVTLPGPPEQLVPILSQRKCFYLLMLLICFCSCFGLAAHSEHGLKVGSAVAAIAPFFVLFYMLTTTSLMQRFWYGKPVGWWCAVLCFWCAIQLLVGVGVLSAIFVQNKGKPAPESPAADA